MWIAIEATTLVSAPLIYFERTQRSIEATWKYLVICSVGIALALLGIYCLAYASLQAGLGTALTLENVLKNAPHLSKPWLHVSFILLLVGFGTKMGLAPMHTWKPEVYGEAPAVVGAMFAGGLTSCAFLALLRISQICIAAGEQTYISQILLVFGLVSMVVASVFMVNQRDFKRLLAYSSVEHMGILALGLGIGGAAMFGTLLHIITNGLTKGVLFLSAGNIDRVYKSKSIDLVSGAMSRLPLSAALFLAGFFAITGSPPFGPFISEFAILNGAIDGGRFITAGLYLSLLLMVFIGMGKTVLQVVQGPVSPAGLNESNHENFLTVAPIIALLGFVILLGIYLPIPLTELLNDGVLFLEGR
jgi:hydrogenase-4 component F